ncbi:MAG: peptidylprolyl isomerase [Phycisphaerales bacterium]|nr:peptidylprolyl isomerase [Phycisphaerales bacterium]
MASLPVGLEQTPSPLAHQLRAVLRPERTVIVAGEQIWVEFLLINTSDETLVLTLPNCPMVDPDPPVMGLPLEHIFSGKQYRALVIEEVHSLLSGAQSQVDRHPTGPVPLVRLAPRSSVGRLLELTNYYRLLRMGGEYRLVWRPYNGEVESEPIVIRVMPEQQAVIDTNYGLMKMRFYYQQAPLHVKNFVELVEQRFYNFKTIHRVIPGGLIQGGCPRGDGHGLRDDGKRLSAEFSDIPFERGTVGMARAMSDPDSASCQFFICLDRQPSFDGQQTVFGYLVDQESFNTLDKIAALPTSGPPRFRPLEDQKVYIRTISLENVPQERSANPTGAESGSTTQPSQVDPELLPGRAMWPVIPASGPSVLRVLPRSNPATAPADE